MQKRNISLVSFILLAIFVVFSFAPVICEVTNWEAEAQYMYGIYIGDVYTKGWSHLNSFADYAHANSFLGILVFVCLVSAIAGILALVLQFVDKQSKYISLLTYSPAISAISFILFSALYMLPEEIPNSYSPNGYLGAEPAWGFYIELALIIAVSVMSVLIALGKVKNNPATAASRIPQVDAADELLKYKNLLDEGIISPEEFDAKKKQLLNL